MKTALEALICLTEEKKSLLVHMREDCTAQHGNISSDNLDGMEYLINRREEYMRRIEKIDAEFLKSVEQCRAKRGGVDLKMWEKAYPEEWGWLQKLTAEIQELYMDILKEDKANTLAMQNKMADSRSELKQVKDGQRLNQAYYPPYSENARIDDSF